MSTGRRDFLKVLGVGAVCAPYLATTTVIADAVQERRRPPQPLPVLPDGGVLTAEHYQQMTERVNALSEVLL